MFRSNIPGSSSSDNTLAPPALSELAPASSEAPPFVASAPSSLSQKELDSQREIEEWMISEGVSLGELGQTPQQHEFVSSEVLVAADEGVPPPPSEASVSEAVRSILLPPMPSITAVLAVEQKPQGDAS